ncbi:peptidylprolyl isomerase fpr4 [Tulasnella sp. 419]|nr:peptidylprolyl isomerase fpr4 [Tulasnella sp. 419]
MAEAVAIWSQVVKPGTRVIIDPLGDYRVTNIAFGENVVDEKGRSTIKFYQAINREYEEDEEPEFEKQAIVIAHLIPGKIETQAVNLVVTDNEVVAFEVTGKNEVHLVGNYIATGHPDIESEMDSDEEDAYPLEDVSSDVEIEHGEFESDDEDFSNRFEEVVDEVIVPAEADKTKTKRARENAGEMEVDGADEAAGDEGLSKKKKKKKNKKLKAEGGVAVPTGGPEAESPAKTSESKGSPSKVDSEKPSAKKDKVAGGKAVAFSETTDKAKKDAVAKAEKYKAGAKPENIFVTPGGVVVDQRKTGTGPLSKKGQRLTMRYIGKLENGKMFDQNTSGKPFVFNLGKGEVIKGWDEGLVNMAVNSERILIIPPTMGYGKTKMDGIPPNSTLYFEVKLLRIQ